MPVLPHVPAHLPSHALPASAPLDTARLQAGLAAAGLAGTAEVVATIDSTNSELLRRLRAVPPCVLPALLAAEIQHNGRGRQGRRWLAPAGSAITVSLARRLALTPAALGGLSLVCGLAVLAVLERQGVRALLKWPNDVLVDGRKIAGILVEVHAAHSGTSDVVIGIGINVDLPPDALAGLENGALAPTDVRSARHQAGVPLSAAIDRTTLLLDLARAVHQHLDTFEAAGFGPFVAPWNARHAWRDQAVELHDGNKLTCRGIARDIDDGGRLQVDTAAGPRTIVSGEVSLRRAA